MKIVNMIAAIACLVGSVYFFCFSGEAIPAIWFMGLAIYNRLEAMD